uniref:Uncharacterized protein n=1 Tax=Anguilla anguilla TaxID=7936 RepID=A0A0E9XFP3_ANGAN
MCSTSRTPDATNLEELHQVCSKPGFGWGTTVLNLYTTKQNKKLQYQYPVNIPITTYRKSGDKKQVAILMRLREHKNTHCNTSVANECVQEEHTVKGILLSFLSSSCPNIGEILQKQKHSIF